MKTVDSIVAGGGPVGLFAALCLHERDVSVHVVEPEWPRPFRSYACVLQPAAVGAFVTLGLGQALENAGHRIDRLSVYCGPDRVAEVDLQRLDSPSPYLIAVPQADLELLLVEALRRRHVPICWHQRVTELAMRDGHVLATLSHEGEASREPKPGVQRASSAQPDTRRVEYVLGADGQSSACRRALGIDQRQQQPSRAFGVYEFTADLSALRHEARIVLWPDGIGTFLPLGETLGRWSFALSDQLAEPPSREQLSRCISRWAPWFSPAPEQLAWGAVAEFETAIARRYGSGRIWLAGDAAHVAHPLGFHSMNRGFSEATALAQIIAERLHGQPFHDRPFERFEAEHGSAWRQLFPDPTRVRSNGVFSGADAARLASCLPASGQELRQVLDQLQIRVEPGEPFV